MRYSVNERSSAYPTHLSWICATIIIFIAHIYLLQASVGRPTVLTLTDRKNDQNANPSQN